MLSRCILDFDVGVGAFVVGLSQSSSFFAQSGCFITDLFACFISNDCTAVAGSGKVGIS